MNKKEPDVYRPGKILVCFGGEKEKTFYNDPNYQTQHNYKSEQEILRGYEAVGLLKFH